LTGPGFQNLLLTIFGLFETRFSVRPDWTGLKVGKEEGGKGHNKTEGPGFINFFT